MKRKEGPDAPKASSSSSAPAKKRVRREERSTSGSLLHPIAIPDDEDDLPQEVNPDHTSADPNPSSFLDYTPSMPLPPHSVTASPRLYPLPSNRTSESILAPYLYPANPTQDENPGNIPQDELAALFGAEPDIDI